MAEPTKLLILGGTGEARELATRATELPGLSVVTSLAGRTRSPRKPCGALRSGGFGGVAGLEAYLRAEAVGLVIDATHPFATRISANAAEACRASRVPLLALRRAAWTRHPGDRWIEAASVADAAAAVEAHGERVFVTVGGNELEPFASRAGLWLLVRVVEPPDATIAIANGEIVVARGPFAVDDEKRLMTKHRIDCLVSKNAGGNATYAKIAAARELGLPVIMVRQPPPATGEAVADVGAAIDWLRARLS